MLFVVFLSFTFLVSFSPELQKCSLNYLETDHDKSSNVFIVNTSICP